MTLCFIDIHTHIEVDPAVDISVLNVMEHFELIGERKLCSIGLHPAHLGGHVDALNVMEAAASLDHVLAIGECGLDRLTPTDFQLQLAVFRRQIRLANNVGKPLIIHCARAFDEVIQCLRAEGTNVPVIFHGFNNKVAIAERLLSLGYFLSFGQALGNTRFPAASALRVAPIERFFLETDNSSANISEIYSLAAVVRDISLEELILQQHRNFKRVFAYDAGYRVAIEN